MAQEVVDWTDMFNGANDSILYVKLTPKPHKIKKIQELADRVQTIQDIRKRKEAVENPCTCIGFVHDSMADGRRVLTTAHGLQHIYSGAHPLTAEKVRLFTASLVCYHHEEARRLAGQPEEARKYVNADITAWDSSSDMLLLTVGVQSLKNFHDDGVCTRPHPSLLVDRSIPRHASHCMMVSWNKLKGSTSSPRDIDMMSANEMGYKMTLLEVYIDTQAGMSGAPLLDVHGMVIGMLHGGFGGTHSYFVASRHFYKWYQSTRGCPRMQ